MARLGLMRVPEGQDIGISLLGPAREVQLSHDKEAVIVACASMMSWRKVQSATDEVVFSAFERHTSPGKQ